MSISSNRAGPLLRPRYHFRLKKRTLPQRLRKRARIIGIVLAGGLSSRMGYDKALVRLSGGENPDILARTVTLLQDICGRAIVVGRQQEGYACVPDLAPGHGPVGGIATALEHCQGAACLVLSCDLPFMERRVLDNLIAHRNRRPQGTHVTAYQQKDTGNIEALVAIYEPECLPYFQICVNERLLKINRVVPAHLQHYVPYGGDESLPFFNLNYPADVETACRITRSQASEQG